MNPSLRPKEFSIEDGNELIRLTTSVEGDFYADWNALIKAIKAVRGYVHALAANESPNKDEGANIITYTTLIYEKSQVIDLALRKLEITDVWYALVWFLDWCKKHGKM